MSRILIARGLILVAIGLLWRAARAIATIKALKLRSKRMAMRRQSL